MSVALRRSMSPAEYAMVMPHRASQWCRYINGDYHTSNDAASRPHEWVCERASRSQGPAASRLLATPCGLTCDGHKPYLEAVEQALGA